MIRTDLYRFSHGKAPRANQHGWWAFCPADKARADDALEHTVWFRGTFKEARACLICTNPTQPYEVMP